MCAKVTLLVGSLTSLVAQLQACNTPQENEEDAPKGAEKPKEKPEKLKEKPKKEV
jgi:hypothetical protein